MLYACIIISNTSLWKAFPLHNYRHGVPRGAVASLYKALHKLSDPRRGQGKRYELALILCLLVLAKLAGQTSLSGATDWIRHRAASLADHFGPLRTAPKEYAVPDDVLQRASESGCEAP